MNKIAAGLLAAICGMTLTVGSTVAKDVKVAGYTKKDGTKVEGYTKTVKDKDTIEVKGYTKADGTKVKGYTRKKSTK